MIKLKIKKLSDTSIRIEQPSHIPGRAPLIQHFPTQFKAIDENESSNRVTVKTDESPFTAITVLFDEIEITNGSTVTIPTSVGEAVTLLNAFIGNFSGGGTSSTTTDIALSITKQGINGAVIPSVFSWMEDLTVKEVLLMSNAAGGLSIQTGGDTYNEDTILDVEIPAGQELTITDFDIEAGEEQGNVIIIFKKIKS
jgi:hypothetical protein